MEAILDAGLPFVSGPQWLGEQVLSKHHVLAVAGTHGKTTTTAMLAWILEATGRSPGYLVGGVPNNFDVSARIGQKSEHAPKPFLLLKPTSTIRPFLISVGNLFITEHERQY